MCTKSTVVFEQINNITEQGKCYLSDDICQPKNSNISQVYL